MLMPLTPWCRLRPWAVVLAACVPSTVQQVVRHFRQRILAGLCVLGLLACVAICPRTWRGLALGGPGRYHF